MGRSRYSGACTEADGIQLIPVRCDRDCHGRRRPRSRFFFAAALSRLAIVVENDGQAHNADAAHHAISGRRARHGITAS